ncbi:MAG: hypothetical protein ACJZ9F_03505 [Rhodospirillaceae bacterium]
MKIVTFSTLIVTAALGLTTTAQTTLARDEVRVVGSSADGDGFKMDEFLCTKCGHTADADENAARVIGLKGMWQRQLPKYKPGKTLAEDKKFDAFLKQHAEQHGIDVGEPRSKSWDEFEGESFDVVITVWDQAASESCPVFFGNHEKLYWSTPDPAKAQGSDDEINAAFDEAFNMLRNRIETELL